VLHRLLANTSGGSVTGAAVLIVDDDDRMRETLGILLSSLGHQVVPVADVAGACQALTDRDLDLVISDLRMPGGSGLDVLDAAQRLRPGTPVILLTAFGTVETAVLAMQRGAADYVLKPFETSELEVRIARALAQRRSQIENEYWRDESAANHAAEGLIGVSPALRGVLELVRQVAPSSASVLITGETGTGKELVARAIHGRSPRAEQLLVPVHLAAVPLELLEAELFGHTRGAFTGAVADRPGKFELADGGTLFLDEIGEAPAALQVKLLRVLQDGVVERVGSNRSQRVDARVMAATNRDLTAEIAAGRFRSDLYYRLRVVEIRVPPLRERREDIRYLTAHFLRRFGTRRPRGVPAITEPALRRLEDYLWPGNVRELENVIERACVLCTGETIDSSLLDLHRPPVERSESAPGTRLDEALDRLERDMILQALDEAKQVKARAARLLGISERSLWYKLRKHNLI
jgi:two-component system, NtrC family, response regulator AtoC